MDTASYFQLSVARLTALTMRRGVSAGPEGIFTGARRPDPRTLTWVPPTSMTRIFMGRPPWLAARVYPTARTRTTLDDAGPRRVTSRAPCARSDRKPSGRHDPGASFSDGVHVGRYGPGRT